ncbi:MAG: T9SS type A sorting domain-containing protein [Bacteroidota bacterium]
MRTKHLLRTTVFTFCFSLFSFHFANAQTNVSGGIYTNTTWTKVNSPYIVNDTVVVFPGVTLTIEPGVTVKFANDKILISRQGKINAVGTSVDSITFTSNSLSPHKGSWSEIYINGGNMVSAFQYCNFEYASTAIHNHYLSGNTNSTIYLQITNSRFLHNDNGVFCIGNGGGFTTIQSSEFYDNNAATAGAQIILNNCAIHHNIFGVSIYSFYNTYTYMNDCYIYANHYGIGGAPFGASDGATQFSVRNSVISCNTVAGIVEGEYSNIVDTIFNCVIRNNPVGILDTFGSGMFVSKCIIENNNIGLRLYASTNKNISCNKICNSVWDVYCRTNFTNSLGMSNNYWCTTDSTIISSKIYDGYDNISLGLINFSPIDASQCYAVGIVNPTDTFQCQVNGCNLVVSASVIHASCDTCHTGSATAYVTYGSSPITYTWNTSPLQTNQTAVGLAPGTYTICVADANGCTACNTVFIDSSNCSGFSVSASAANATCSSCNDGTAHVVATGGAMPYSYTWYTSPLQNTATATGVSRGTYPVCVTDVNGCVACDTVVVSIGNCSAHFNLYPDSVPHNYTAVNMASGNGALTYLWAWGDGSTDTGPYPSHTYASAGLYNICLTITDTAGCTNTYCNNFYLMRTTNTIIQVNVIPDNTTGIQSAIANPQFEMFPNPAKNAFTISVDETMLGSTATITDITGRKMAAVQLATRNLQLATDHFASGVYFVTVSNEKGSVTKKLIIHK